MNRINYLNKITTHAARFVVEVEGFNSSGHYHINIHAENFLIPVLNEVFNIKLENLNATQKKNFPAIDLADFTNRVAFQVTATADFSKIKSTLELFFEHNLDKHFDVLYIYILTHKKEKYPENKLNKILPVNFSFNAGENILDKDDLLQRINSISSTVTLQHLAKLYEHEFSDVQIEMRKIGFESGYLANTPEDIFPNLLPITFSNELYVASLNVDKDAIIAKVNSYLIAAGKRPVKSLKPGKFVKHALKQFGCRTKDWILYENSLYTFRNLNDAKEPLRQIVDHGTITPISCKDFFDSDENNMRVFKHLLRNSLTELCLKKGIEWFGESQVFRFANNTDAPNKKQIKWKGKNEATKTVIFEMYNKKEGHIVCYRNLAFRAAFEYFADQWYLSVNPTWSFTNPYGYRKSKYESGYMSGLKRMENNSTVYNYFRFFGYHLTYKDLFTEEYPHLTISKPFPLSISPSLDDKTWKPVKLPEKTTDVPDTTIEADTELTKTLFD